MGRREPVSSGPDRIFRHHPLPMLRSHRCALWLTRPPAWPRRAAGDFTDDVPTRCNTTQCPRR